MKNLFLLFFGLLIGGFLDAQTLGKPKFVSQQVVGLLEGESGSAFQIQSVNGFQIQKWFMGLGAGIDWYEYRSVPIFISTNYDLNRSNRSFFLNLDLGTNIPWTHSKYTTGILLKSDFQAKLYTNVGIGYKFRLKNTKDGFLINVGFSSKRLGEIQTLQSYCISRSCELQTSEEKYDYKMRRVSVRVGWLF